MLRRMTMTSLRRIQSTAKNKTTRSLSASATATPKPWGTPMVESTGDYRQEAWLESHIGGPLYEHQPNLPRLPIPSVEQTLQRFLPTALPLCQSQQEADKLQQAVANFPKQAQLLQT